MLSGGPIPSPYKALTLRRARRPVLVLRAASPTPAAWRRWPDLRSSSAEATKIARKWVLGVSVESQRNEIRGKAAFQKAAKEHEARAVERLREQEKRLTDRDQFEAGWSDTRARIVLPALRQIREEVLTPAGWTSEVRSDDKEESATIEVIRVACMRLGQREGPRSRSYRSTFAHEFLFFS